MAGRDGGKRVVMLAPQNTEDPVEDIAMKKIHEVDSRNIKRGWKVKRGVKTEGVVRISRSRIPEHRKAMQLFETKARDAWSLGDPVLVNATASGAAAVPRGRRDQGPQYCTACTGCIPGMQSVDVHVELEGARYPWVWIGTVS